MYNYGQYEVKEQPQYYQVTIDDNLSKVKIKKSIIEGLQIEKEDPEMIAILLAIIETTRYNNQALGENKDTLIIKEPEFKSSLKLGLKFISIEEMIFEISKMKYYQIKEYFE